MPQEQDNRPDPDPAAAAAQEPAAGEQDLIAPNTAPDGEATHDTRESGPLEGGPENAEPQTTGPEDDTLGEAAAPDAGSPATDTPPNDRADDSPDPAATLPAGDDPAAADLAPATPPRPRPVCTGALFGKLPTRGDFIARNMPRHVQRPFEDWLIPLVQDARAELGANWTTIWRGAGPWRFWIGPEVLGGSWQRDMRKTGHDQTSTATAGTTGAMTGVILPSADRHGRDFPLVLLLADPVSRLMPPPVTASPDRGWYDLCDEVLYAARAGAELTTIEAALDQLPGPILPEGAQDMDALLAQQALWAQGTDTLEDGTSRIWQDIAQADHHLAASHRSYWWQAPRAGAAQRVLTLAGLPDAGSFAFMLSQGHPEVLVSGSNAVPDALTDPSTGPLTGPPVAPDPSS